MTANIMLSFIINVVSLVALSGCLVVLSAILVDIYRTRSERS